MNTHTSHIRRGFCALGAAATLGLALAGPATARPEPGEPIGRSSGGTTPTRIIKVPVDDNAFELFQVGGGMLAGVALAGAGMALASRRRHAGLHPA